LNKRYTIERCALAPRKQIAVRDHDGVSDRAVLDALAHGGVKWLVVGVESLATKLGSTARSTSTTASAASSTTARTSAG
jgi:hypothetical protein